MMTVEISRDPWATLDDLWGIEVGEAVDDGIGPVAFYGRCSTEDNQDPETSRGWQFGNAREVRRAVGRPDRRGVLRHRQSRSVPWERRDEASRLLAALKDPHRGWNAVVVGEGTRCWFGNQFSLIAPRFAAYGVDLWVPELGGKYDPRNPSHKMLMSVLGGMSESERQHVQARVRAAMDAQVLNEGRHQGGRAPYGYVVVDGGPHPNPRKAAEGYRLRVLAIDERVRMGRAADLRRVPERSAETGRSPTGSTGTAFRARPRGGRTRTGIGWRTAGRAARCGRFWRTRATPATRSSGGGRSTRRCSIPDDVAAGHVVRFRKASPDRVVRSRKPAHPKIVEIEDFTEAQVLRKSKGGLRTARKTERAGRAVKHRYLFRGRIRCDICGRKMEGSPRKKAMYYRCPARTLAPGSPALTSHPGAVYLREDVIQDAVNGWIGHVFDRKNRDRTVAALMDSQEPVVEVGRDSAKRRLADAEAKLMRFQDAIKAGVDPAALVEAINEAQARARRVTSCPGQRPGADRAQRRRDLRGDGPDRRRQRGVARSRADETRRVVRRDRPASVGTSKTPTKLMSPSTPWG